MTATNWPWVSIECAFALGAALGIIVGRRLWRPRENPAKTQH